MTKTELLAALAEVRAEISRLNRAAGQTVFNPAATSALEVVMEELGEDA